MAVWWQIGAGMIGIAAILTLFCTYAMYRVAVARWIPFQSMAGSSRRRAHMRAVDRELEWFWAQKPQSVSVQSFDGLRLHAYLLPCKGSERAVLFMHGYRAVGGAYDFANQLRFYYELGYTVLVPDQRAHGKSEGKFISYGIRERYDCKAWLDYLNETAAPRDVFVQGVSMGCATVLLAAGLGMPENVRGLIADCGFTSPWEICSHVLTQGYHLPRRPLMTLANAMVRMAAGFDLREASVMEALAVNHIPVLFVHGGKDDFVPTQMTLRNFEACVAEKQLFIVPQAGHAMSFWVDPEGTRVQTVRFIRAYETENQAEQEAV